jgi:hypothetical protein
MAKAPPEAIGPDSRDHLLYLTIPGEASVNLAAASAALAVAARNTRR